jgi:archaeal type IV pilus assembly protein PilA
MNYRKFRKNAKALSPVIASIILIAVTVAVSVVVAAWMGGLTLGFMGNAEQVTMSNPVFTAAAVTVTARNSGASSATIQSGAVDNGASQTPTVPVTSPVGSLTILKGSTQNIILAGSFTSGAQYQLSLITSKGTTIVYTATCP